MNTILLVIAFAALAALVITWARGFRKPTLFSAVNVLPANVGSSRNSRRYRAAAAIATRYFLVKKGADDEHVAVVAATADEPIGVATDETAAAEDPLDVELLGVTNRTLPMVAKVAIAVGAAVYSNGDGKVTVKPTAAGTYWKVGTAITASGADGDPIEVALCKPRKLIVVAALTQGAAGTLTALAVSNPPTQAEVTAIRNEAGKLQDDFLILSAALSGDADVTVATS